MNKLQFRITKPELIKTSQLRHCNVQTIKMSQADSSVPQAPKSQTSNEYIESLSAGKTRTSVSFRNRDDSRRSELPQLNVNRVKWQRIVDNKRPKKEWIPYYAREDDDWDDEEEFTIE